MLSSGVFRHRRWHQALKKKKIFKRQQRPAEKQASKASKSIWRA